MDPSDEFHDEWDPFGNDQPNFSQDVTDEIFFEHDIFSDSSSSAFSSAYNSTNSFSHFAECKKPDSYPQPPIRMNQPPICQPTTKYQTSNRHRHQSITIAMPTIAARVGLSTQDIFKISANRKSVPWVSTNHLAASSDQLFNDLCQNPSSTLNPARLGFIPSYYWPDQNIAFGALISEFFHRKNNINCRFLHRLYNALRISSINPFWQDIAGVTWVNQHVLRINKGQFGRLLGIKSIDGSLFHQQGNFIANEFVELNREQALQYCPGFDIDSVDFENIRLLCHRQARITAQSSERDIMEFLQYLKAQNKRH